MAPLDGSHIMVVFREITTHFKTSDSFKIREAWVKNMKTSERADIFEYETDNGDYLEIGQPLGWFTIPDSFNGDYIVDNYQ